MVLLRILISFLFRYKECEHEETDGVKNNKENPLIPQPPPVFKPVAATPFQFKPFQLKASCLFGTDSKDAMGNKSNTIIFDHQRIITIVHRIHKQMLAFVKSER